MNTRARLLILCCWAILAASIQRTHAQWLTQTIDLKAGYARATVWTNDLTHAYVHENSAYSS